MKQTARTVALQALLQMDENEGYSNIIIDKALRGAELERRDAALASAIFYGVLEKRLTLDHFLHQCLTDPEKKLNVAVQNALRCGAYQILYLDRVPESAAVNETVNALKELDKASYAGFVNGVLRGLLRRKEELSLPKGDGVSAWSLRYNIPEELIALWRDAYGTEITRKILDSFQEKAKLFLRINTQKTTPEALKESLERDGMRLELLGSPSGAAVLEGCGSPASLPQFTEGLFHVQDLSAQLVCGLLSPRRGETVCDCCAAPGGKTFTLSERMSGTGTVYAFDLYNGRVGLIKKGAQRLGLTNIEARMNDATKPFPNIPPVDGMLCDVPCSGYGVIRRKPEIRYKELSSLKGLPGLQYTILKQASAAVRPGGKLVYSTCTLNPAENAGVAERFLRENSGYEPVAIDLPGVERSIHEPGYMLTMMPFSGASDGFFAAAFRKK